MPSLDSFFANLGILAYDEIHPSCSFATTLFSRGLCQNLRPSQPNMPNAQVLGEDDKLYQTLDDMGHPSRVIKAVLHAQSAFSSFFDQAFLEALTVFSKICFNSLFKISTWPLVYG